MTREPIVIVNAIAVAVIALTGLFSWGGAAETIVTAIVALAATLFSRSKVAPV